MWHGLETSTKFGLLKLEKETSLKAESDELAVGSAPIVMQGGSRSKDGGAVGRKYNHFLNGPNCIQSSYKPVPPAAEEAEDKSREMDFILETKEKTVCFQNKHLILQNPQTEGGQVFAPL